MPGITPSQTIGPFAAPSLTRSVGSRPAAGSPRSARIAGTTNRMEHTMDETGLPGSPKTGFPSTVPKASGLAGRIATCIHLMEPPLSRSSTTFT